MNVFEDPLNPTMDDMMDENEGGTELENYTENIIKENPIHISTQQRTTKKKLTIVRGIPDDIDIVLVSRAWQKLFHCVSAVKYDKSTKEYFIQINGDHKNEVKEFLIHEGIGREDNIKMHGDV